MENQRVEYKSNWQDSHLKTIAAFANTVRWQVLYSLWINYPGSERQRTHKFLAKKEKSVLGYYVV